MYRVSIREIEDLNRIKSCLEERSVNLDQITYDKQAQSIDIPLTVIERGGSILRNFLFFRQWEHNVVSACLHILNARNCGIVDDTKKGVGVINNLSYENDIVTIIFKEEIAVKVTVSNLFLELSVTENVVDFKRYFARKCRWPRLYP